MKLFNLSTDFIGRPPKPTLRGKIYYLRQRVAGKDCWRSLHTSDKREAQYLALEIWRARQNDRIRDIIPAPPVKISTIWARYTESERFTDLAGSTMNSKTVVWTTFAHWCTEHKISYPEQLTCDLAKKYLSGNDRKNKTFNNVLNDLRMVFQYGGATRNVFDEIERLPIYRCAMEKQSAKFRAFTDDEMDRLEDTIARSKMKHHDEWLMAAKISRNTGLRYKDVALFRWDQIQADELGQYIELAPHKTDKKTGGKVVYIRLIPDIARLLMIWKVSHCGDYVLPDLMKEYERDEKNASKPFSSLCRRSGIDGSFHCFRVSIITKAAKAGIDLEEFGGVVGHTTETQTRAYNRAALTIDMERVVSIRLA